MAVAARSLEAFLIEEGTVSEETLEKARERQREGKGLGDVLQEMGAIDPATWAQALARHFGLPFSERLPEDAEILELINQLPINFAKRCLLLPVQRDGETVVVATADPANLGPLDDVRLLLRKPIRVMVAPGPVIVDAINRVYDLASGSASELMDDLDEERLDLMATDLEEPRDLLEADDEAPIIRLVNSLLFQAAKDRASDIHIEPFERDLTVRFRIDGILYDIISPPKRFQPIIISRVKIMAGPQHRREAPAAGRTHPHPPRGQGHRHPRLDRPDRLRRTRRHASARQGDHGAAARRAWPRRNEARFGAQTDQAEPRHHAGHRARPGSGKTTTLYAALSKINTTDKNIITIEDPIEYQLHGIGQIQVNPKIELTFASGLRSILRQDPDVIMVGEIRDRETAEIAIQAALTGHLVFSTLHTNDSFGADDPAARHGHRAVPGVVVGDRGDGAASGAPGVPCVSRALSPDP